MIDISKTVPDSYVSLFKPYKITMKIAFLQDVATDAMIFFV